MTIYIPAAQWDDLKKIVGVTHGIGPEAELIVSVTRWGSRDDVLLRFRRA